MAENKKNKNITSLLWAVISIQSLVSYIVGAILIFKGFMIAGILLYLHGAIFLLFLVSEYYKGGKRK